jgi:hypothetical protein
MAVGNLLDRCRRLWNDFLGRPAGPPVIRIVPTPPVAPAPPHEASAPAGTTAPVPLKTDRDYWQVRIAEMFLHDATGWLNTYDPLVVVISEFTYEGTQHAVPKLVGPGMLAELGGAKEPLGMVYRDTRVAGLHPYLGGRINLALVLCRAKRSDVARTLLTVLESAGAALDLAAQLNPYLRIGKVVLDGLDRLRSSNDIAPIAGTRQEHDPDGGDYLGPMRLFVASAPEHGRVALINGKIVDDERGLPIDGDRLMWVHDQLCYLWTDNLCYPYRASDFVVAELLATPARTDLSLLPIWPAWQQVLRDASCGTAQGLELAQTGLKALYQQMLHSPDMTRAHVKETILAWKKEMLEAHDLAVNLGTRESTGGGPEAVEADLQRQALDLFAS